MPLPDELRDRLRALTLREGETGAAARLGVSRVTVARAIAGLGLRRGTLAHLTAQLTMTEGEPPPTSPTPEAP